MSITPQAIKDQEFQVKFRGYETIEVKAYLELMAEEFFALQESKQAEEEAKEELRVENFQLRERNEELERLTEEREESSQRDLEIVQKKDEEIAELKKALDEFEQDVAERLTEKNKLKEEIALRDEELAKEKKIAADALVEIENLRLKITEKETQIESLRQEEVDFKATIVSAQKFAESVKKKAEEDAAFFLDQAKKEVDVFRRKAQQELADLPLEIEELRERREKVRKELRDVLHSYLKMLDEVDQSVPNEVEELSNLFESISLEEESAPVEND